MISPLDSHNRRSIRLKAYDYSQSGAYFVTICTHQRERLFGEVADGVMQLRVFGEIVQEEWLRTPQIRPEVEIDAFVIMPNHIHGIIVITGDGRTTSNLKTKPSNQSHPVGANRRFAPTPTASSQSNRPKGTKPGSLGAILQQFKSVVTKRINLLRDTPGASVWQRNYYESIIRDESTLNTVRLYIETNPTNWQTDPDNL
ncbi:MAG TPA: transposase [Phototrophicaceae bacterium]|jgi:REP element-mobilizing transposase RayT|nr:transposase [Phototrophicaceae bacterium]